MEIYWEKLAYLVNTPVQVVKKLFHIDDRTIPRGLGWFAGFDVARVIKDPAFYDFFLQAQDVLLTNESFMSAWMYRNGSNSELWDTPPFWTENYYDITHKNSDLSPRE